MYDESSFMVSFTEPDNTVAVSIKFKNWCSCTEILNYGHQMYSKVGIQLEIKMWSQLAQITFHTPQPRVFNHNITSMEDLGIVLTTPGGYNAD
jgi:hypothetical protein